MTPKEKQAIDFAENSWMDFKDEDEESLLRIGFHNGWDACEKEMKDEAIEFAEWCDRNGFQRISANTINWVSDDINYSGCVYTSGELYQQWKENK